jgi:hypothetical protein
LTAEYWDALALAEFPLSCILKPKLAPFIDRRQFIPTKE